MTWPAPTSQQPPLRASDAEREQSLEWLREHWLAGRLTLEEYEERCDEVHGARYLHELAHTARELPMAPPVARPIPPRQSSGAVASFILGLTAMTLLLFSAGLLFVIALPMSVPAWVMGRNVRRSRIDDRRQIAVAGEVMGAIATTWSVLMVFALALLIRAL